MADRVESVVNLCKRRGFVFPSSEIYGGTRSAWDYGPLGVELKDNIRRQWWQAIVRGRDDVVGIDSSIILAPQVWVASGHVDAFVDPLTECKQCHKRWRADQLLEAYEEKHGAPPPEGLADVVCTNCGNKGQFTEPKDFNGMLRTMVGPVEEAGALHYLRPETAQGIFVNYLNVMTAARKKPPFGIAQVGKSFRNEITPGNFIFRTREFEQMELEYFVPPAESERWYRYWLDERRAWYVRHGIPESLLRVREHARDELSHYSAGTADIEFAFPWGWGELEGVAQRTDFDLARHSTHSGSRLEYFDQAANERYAPYVVEPAAGANRAMAAFLLAAYDEDVVNDEPRTVLRLHPRIAPYQVAVLPLSKKDVLTPTAQRVRRMVAARYMCDYDETQAIGRRYRRQDEVGTPLCITVDFETADDDAVTVRERDSTAQVRVPIAGLMAELESRLGF